MFLCKWCGVYFEENGDNYGEMYCSTDCYNQSQDDRHDGLTEDDE